MGTRKMRLSRDGYVSEIILGRESALFHYVITKQDCVEILCWGQENTIELARKCIDDFIDHEKRRKASTA